MRECRRSKHRARGNRNEGVDDVPDGIDGRDLICHKLDDKERPRNNKHPVMTEIPQIARKRCKPEPLQQTETEDRRIQIDTRKPRRSHGKAERSEIHTLSYTPKLHANVPQNPPSRAAPCALNRRALNNAL